MISDPNKRLQLYTLIIVLLAIPALLINLGLLPYIEDEAIRALVALEMNYSGNYIVPTLNDTYYYSKPPLFNWILNISYKLCGTMDEWSTRLPTVICLVLFCYTIYHVNRKYFDGLKYPLMISLFYLTCGRIIFWDSFRGLIDIGFSWVIYLLFIAVYHYGRQQRYWHMYIIAYGLASIAYMFKGLPAFVFVGLTILAYHISQRSIKRLISLPHVVGGLIMVGILGIYYSIYGIYHESTSVIPGLIDQSTQRTPLRHGLWKTIKHVIHYPFDNIYHFLPWSILGVMFLRKDIWQQIKTNSYIHYLSICFLLNIVVYWISPGTYPRYVLMLIPLIFTVLVYLYSIEGTGWRMLLLRRLFELTILTVPFIIVGVIGLDEVRSVSHWSWKIGVLLLGLITIAVLYFKDKEYRPFFIVMLVLLLRIGFDWFVLPARYTSDKAVITKAQAIHIGEKYKDKSLQLYRNSKLDYTSSFYLARTREKITTRNYDPGDDDHYLIIDTSRTEVPPSYEVVDTFRKRENWMLMYIAERQ